MLAVPSQALLGSQGSRERCDFEVSPPADAAPRAGGEHDCLTPQRALMLALGFEALPSRAAEPPIAGVMTLIITRAARRIAPKTSANSTCQRSPAGRSRAASYWRIRSAVPSSRTPARIQRWSVSSTARMFPGEKYRNADARQGVCLCRLFMRKCSRTPRCCAFLDLPSKCADFVNCQSDYLRLVAETGMREAKAVPSGLSAIPLGDCFPVSEETKPR